MTGANHTDQIAALVARQVGRAPRTPWRVAAECAYGFPTVIASPCVLDDGTRFPTLFWLTCPYLVALASEAESAGWLAKWDDRVAGDAVLAEQLEAADRELRDRRAAESGGNDDCASVGVAGQASSVAAKCVHARVALALAGIHDPIGTALLEQSGTTCPDRYCATLS